MWCLLVKCYPALNASLHKSQIIQCCAHSQPFCVIFISISFTTLYLNKYFKASIQLMWFLISGTLVHSFLYCHCLILPAIGENSSFSIPQVPMARNIHEYSTPGICLAPCSLLYRLYASLEEEEGTFLAGKCDGQFYVLT